ncbi:dermonecrotic toxin domain-containing protein [Pseudomonas sp. IT-P4]|uniref:dermonecrotic toxin domain-containing protein n=1 Tax=Pseudomonas sp. IT-P4 TaxID=3026446 RepID=UPI0039E101B6
MNSSDTNSQFLLPNPEDVQALKDLVTPFVEACPDMHDMAHIEAQGILDKYSIRHIDPDQIWWHRFDNTSVTSTKAFLFWEHYPKPIESLTLPQLVIQRFQAHDQDNADLLDSDGGFYNEGANARIYNETNEVKMYPSKVIKDLWRINFHDRYWDKMSAFWRRHSDNFRTLAKLNFISKALEEHDGSRLSNENLKTVLKAVAGHLSWPITLDLLHAHEPPAEGLRVAPLYIGNYRACDILRIIDRQGRQILYTPGETDAFHVFETSHDLHWWLLCQNNHPDNRARFMAHFPLSAQQQDGDNVGLNHTIDLLYSTWGKYDSSLFDQDAPDINVDTFSWIRDSVRERMFDDADLSLRSNGDLREKMWVGYLSTVTRLFGAMAVAGWPVALAAVGAGLANIGLNIDQAVNGKNAQDRKAGVLGAISSSIETLFNALALGGSAEIAEVDEANDEFTPQENLADEIEHPTGAPPKITVAAPGRAYVLEGENPLAPFETNEVLDGMEVVADEGQYRNVYQTPRGENYIRIDNSYYLVRYVNEMKTWVIIDPANPFSFFRNLPVRLNAEGEWELLTRPGLYGGGKIFGRWPWGRTPDPLPDVASPTTAYDVPQALRTELQPYVSTVDANSLRALSDDFEDISNPGGPLVQFKALRKTLYRDAQAYYQNLPELPPRPTVPNFGPVNRTKDIIKALYKESPSLVIGESHSSVGSKQFLIENMGTLAKQQVKTLYMEHLFNDFHQVDLDIFNSDGVLSEDLESYLNNLDKGHHTDPTGRFTFLKVVKAARKNHIRVQAIDCAASYRVENMHEVTPFHRHKMMNFFSKIIIESDQAAKGPHRWIALVGNTHSNTWEGVAGISELEGGIGLRVKSAEIAQPTSIEPDPGESGSSGTDTTVYIVKNDLLLKVESPELARELVLEAALNQPGMLSIEKYGNQLELVHRARDGSLVRTLIHADATGVYIERPQWGSINCKRFASLADLSNALRRNGLKPTRIP